MSNTKKDSKAIQALKAIESGGGLYAARFVNICNNNTSLFGTVGSGKRRDWQRFYDKLKRRSVLSYTNLLVGESVEMHPSTHAKLNEEDPQVQVDASTEDVAALSEALHGLAIDNASTAQTEPTATSNPPDAVPSIVPVPSMFPTPVRQTRAAYSPARTPMTPMRSHSPYVQAQAQAHPSPSFLNQQTRAPPTPAHPAAGFGFPPSVNEYVQTHSDNLAKKGTRENPNLIFADLNNPHLNFGFEIVHAENIVHNDYERSAFIIRKSCLIPDAKSWKMTFVTEGAYAYHSVLVEAPGRDWIMSQTDIFKEKTQEEHSITSWFTSIDANDVQFKVNPSFKSIFTHIVLPTGNLLDNTIFSAEDTVQKHLVGIGKKAKEIKDSPVDVAGVMIYWRIAEVGGRRVVSVGDVSDDPNTLNFF